MKILGLHDTLETQRCLLQIPKESQANDIWNKISENTVKYMIWNKGETVQETLDNIKKSISRAEKGLSWDAAIYDKESGNFIGRCGITEIYTDIPALQIGYWLADAYWGKGLMPECVSRIIHYAFEENSFEKIIIRCDSKNTNSKKVALKCGLQLEGEFKNHERVKGRLKDTSFFGITREEYFSKK